MSLDLYTSVGDGEPVESTDNLRENTLDENLHHPARIREDSLDNLRLLRDSRTDLFEQHFHARLGSRRRSIRIPNRFPASDDQSISPTKTYMSIRPGLSEGPSPFSTSSFSASSSNRSFEMKKSCWLT